MYLWTFGPLYLRIFVPLNLWTFESLYRWVVEPLNLCTFGPLYLWTFDPLILWIKIVQQRGLRKRGFDFQFSIVWLFSLDLTIRIQVSKFVQLYYNYTINFLVVILAVLHSIVPWNLCTFVSLYLWTFVSLDLWIFGFLDLWIIESLWSFGPLNLWIVGPFKIQDSGFRNRNWEFKEAPFTFQLYFNYLLI